MLSISQEDPHRAEVVELLRHSDDYSSVLYPIEWRYAVDVEFLA